MTAAALGATVPTAHPHVLEHADWTSTQPAGAGAVRELIDLTLTTQGHPITDLRPQPDPAAQIRLRAGVTARSLLVGGREGSPGWVASGTWTLVLGWRIVEEVEFGRPAWGLALAHLVASKLTSWRRLSSRS